jgi:hypothetical protein
VILTLAFSILVAGPTLAVFMTKFFESMNIYVPDDDDDDDDDD